MPDKGAAASPSELIDARFQELADRWGTTFGKGASLGDPAGLHQAAFQRVGLIMRDQPILRLP